MGKRVAYSSMLIALSMIFSYIELLIPISVGIPGVKLGLANLVVITGLYYLPATQVIIIGITRIVLSGFLFGSMSGILYSLAGGIFSFIVMLLLYKTKKLSIVGVSMSGGVCHNIGQILVAALVVENIAVLYYLPILLITGLVAGMVIGIIGRQVSKYMKFSL